MLSLVVSYPVSNTFSCQVPLKSSDSEEKEEKEYYQGSQQKEPK